jgi:hypothetical protein
MVPLQLVSGTAHVHMQPSELPLCSQRALFAQVNKFGWQAREKRTARQLSKPTWGIECAIQTNKRRHDETGMTEIDMT